MRAFLLPLLAVLLVIAVVAALPLRAEEAEKPKPHEDQQLKEHEVFEKFEAKFSSKDMDHRIQITRWLGHWRHKKVLKKLKSIWLKDPEMELRAVAAEGLGNQTPFTKDAGKTLVKGLVQMKNLASREDPEGADELAQALEAKALASGIKAVGDLGYKKAWEELKGFIDHYHDDVAAEMMLTCGRLKEYRALPVLLEWFNFYPDGYSWAGGSVRVDTGAAGNKDAKAAKAKWKAKYGSRKRKARPAAWDALIQALEMITGEKFETADELKQWMRDNRALLRRHGV